MGIKYIRETYCASDIVELFVVIVVVVVDFARPNSAQQTLQFSNIRSEQTLGMSEIPEATSAMQADRVRFA